LAIPSNLTLPRGADYSVRAAISALVLLMIAAALLGAGWLAMRSISAERARIEESAVKKAREIVRTIDREIIAARSLLSALVSSHHLQQGDVPSFYYQAKQVADEFDINILLRDPAVDVQVFNTLRALDTPPVYGASVEAYAIEREVLRTGGLVVSNVFLGRYSKRYIVAVAQPVPRGDASPYILVLVYRVEKISELMRSVQLEEQWTGSVIGRDNVVIARSDDEWRYIGTRIAVPKPTDADEESVKRGVNRAGVPFHWFSHRSPVTGWRVSVGVPDHILDASSRLALASFIGGGGLLLTFGFLVAHRLGGRVSRTIGELEAAAISARQRGDEQFRMLFESVPNGIVAVDMDGRITLVNARVEEMFGYRRNELIGQPIELLVPPRLRERHADLRWAFNRKASARPMGASADLLGRRKDGSEIPLEIGLNPISTVAGTMVMATVVDVTARRAAAARLDTALAERDDLRRRFMQAQEEERLRLAHELHDETGQNLTAAMLELKGIESVVNEHGRERLRLLRRQLDQMGKSLHRVAWELRPASLDELGLASVLANYVSQWSEQFGIEADFHCGEAKLDALSAEVRTTIYRVVQESLTNIAKHARGVGAVGVVVDRADNVLQVTIEDDGCGFDAKTPAEKGRNRKGLGIPGMRERLSLIGGRFEIESSIGVGTTIFIRIPLERRSEAA